jgi:hypothetical protein
LLVERFFAFGCGGYHSVRTGGVHRANMQFKQAGRPKGVKDSVKRKRSGYILREGKSDRKWMNKTGCKNPSKPN